MFFVHRVTDTIAIPPPSLSLPTRLAVEQAIDAKYPGRVWMDIGLVIARYQTPRKQQQQQTNDRTHTKENDQKGKENDDEDDDIIVGPGVCVAGDAVAHVVTTFSLVTASRKTGLLNEESCCSGLRKMQTIISLSGHDSEQIQSFQGGARPQGPGWVGSDLHSIQGEDIYVDSVISDLL